MGHRRPEPLRTRTYADVACDGYVAGRLTFEEFDFLLDQLFAAGTADMVRSPPPPLKPADPTWRYA